MRRSLKLHPDSSRLTAVHIEVEVSFTRSDRLILAYIVTGKICDIRVPPVMAAARSDELWRHTCFEAFVRASADTGYYEFNFSPSTQWAAYRFSGYRSGMCVASEINVVPIEVRSNPYSYILQTSLEMNRLWSVPRILRWHLGLSAVLEHANGRKSYWALAHPPGEPDFHHADCFAHELSPVAQP